MPTTEEINELRQLYAERKIHSDRIDAVLNRIQALLMKQPDYVEWMECDGRHEKLPAWIHQVTGGRPYMRPPEKPVVSQKKYTKRANPDMVAVYKNMMKNFTGG